MIPKTEQLFPTPVRLVKDYLAALEHLRSEGQLLVGPLPLRSNVPRDDTRSYEGDDETMPEAQYFAYQVVSETVRQMGDGGHFLLQIAVHNARNGSLKGYEFAGIGARVVRSGNTRERRRGDRLAHELAVLIYAGLHLFETTLTLEAKRRMAKIAKNGQ